MTMTTEIALRSLEDVAALIASRQLSPVELTQTLLERIERLNPRLNAYITVTADAALAEARAAEREIAGGNYRGALHGVPIAVKDLFQTRGVRTTAGSGILSDWLPDDDATVVTKLRDAGAVSLGKLGMHEWAYGCTSDNKFFGAIRNPWDTEVIPGGSSGGSGVAAAAGLAYATMGSDTGGSIRIPAALCGCVGMMPTYGRASLFGAVPLSWNMDHPGPLTRTVRDSAIVLAAISGQDPRDPTTEPVPVPDWLDGIDRGPRGLRIGVPTTFFDHLDHEVETSVRAALSALESAGATVVDVDVSEDLPAYIQSLWAVSLADALAFHAERFPSRRAEYSPDVAALLDLGVPLTGAQYAQAMRVVQHARHGGADRWLEGLDVLAMPTTPIVAGGIEASRVENPTARLVALTSVFDATGQPAISVPCGLSPQGLPVGIMFAGRRWDESSVLWAGRAYEQVRGAFPAPPLA
ncbi:MAG: amidase [Chloroflexi bacterium]|nr:amidase [Chloroflexota bacterium]